MQDPTSDVDEPVGGFGRFTALEEADCLDLLRTHQVGRVGWTDERGPMILPVTYGLHRGQLVFRTAPDGPLADLADVREVAFQIDDFDVETATGWSVLVRARSTTPIDPDELPDVWSAAVPEPWAAGERNLFIVLEMLGVTGRIVARED